MITCLSLDCKERKSICCGAISKNVSGDEGTGYFACSSCGNEFISGECEAKQSTEKVMSQPHQDEGMDWEESFDQKFTDRGNYVYQAEIKDFIRNLLAKDRQQLRKKE